MFPQYLRLKKWLKKERGNDMKKEWFRITVKPIRTLKACARYKHRIFRKGETYTVRRKTTKDDIEWAIRNQKRVGYKVISYLKS